MNQMKEVLLKEIPAESDEAIERCRDILERLAETSVSLQILQETMIGTFLGVLVCLCACVRVLFQPKHYMIVSIEKRLGISFL